MTQTASLSDVELEIAAFHQPAIDSARKMIFWAGLLYPLMPVMMFAMLARLTGPSIFATSAFAIMFGGGLAIWGMHIALAWWAKKKPLPATSIALVVFLAYQGLALHYGYGASPLLAAIWLFVLGRAVLASWRVHKLRTRGVAC